MKKLSIIIITLNEEKYISRLLEKLNNQTYKNFEVIIVDSNSDDNTENIAMEFKNKFLEFRFINMGKRGVSLGRNTGGKLAKYENLLFLDADTLFDNCFLEKFINEIDRKKLESATAQLSSKNTNLLYKTGFFMMNSGIKITKYFSPTGVGACLFSKKYVFDKIGGFDERISLCEDCEFLKRSKQNGFNFGVLDLKFYFDFRRLEQEGLFKTYFKYLKANIYRFTKSELIYDNRFDYNFGHYK